MSLTQNKLGAYANHQRGGNFEDGRETDARALLSCSSRLKAAIEEGGKDLKAYGDAVRHNQRLWTMFQIALLDPQNPLPSHLKNNLINLSNYVDRISFRAVTSFQPELLGELIEINRNIATGLSKKVKNENQASLPAEAGAPPPINRPAVVVTTA